MLLSSSAYAGRIRLTAVVLRLRAWLKLLRGILESNAGITIDAVYRCGRGFRGIQECFQAYLLPERQKRAETPNYWLGTK